MQLKHTLLQRVQPFSHYYGLMRYLALLQFLITLAMPVLLPELDTVVWMLLLALFAFLVASYALLRLAHQYQPDARGLRAWLGGVWENLVIVSWLLLLILLVLGVVKLALFALFP